MCQKHGLKSKQVLQDVTVKIYYWTLFYKLYSYIVWVVTRYEVLNCKSQKILTQEQKKYLSLVTKVIR